MEDSKNLGFYPRYGKKPFKIPAIRNSILNFGSVIVCFEV